MILTTAKNHFDQDIARAEALSTLIGPPVSVPSPQAEDVLRSAWMLAVGASDAYFCDAYADLVSRSIRAMEIEPSIALPDRLANLDIPLGGVLGTHTTGWRWRMLARGLIEKESVLSLNQIKHLFNQFCRDSKKILSLSAIPGWITEPNAKQRIFGTTASAYNGMTPSAKKTQRSKSLKQMNSRYDSIFQRRHDCIHNCDRPKVAIRSVTANQVNKSIEDVKFLIGGCHSRLQVEFPLLLQQIGYSSITRNRVCT